MTQAVQELRASLQNEGYLTDEPLGLTAYLAIKLGKPILAEGPAGTGKTTLAKALASALDRQLIRLQCYEGLDETKALYEWNYRKQLLRVQANQKNTEWEETEENIFGRDYLLERPLLQAITTETPAVLLIDEIDKTDQEFEALLLELLGEFQVTVPELGSLKAVHRPIVVLTSNNSRELTEALRRRCLYAWIDYPTPEREEEILQQNAPELTATVRKKITEIVATIRELDIQKAPSIAETIDWAHTLLALGKDDINRETLVSTLPVIMKHQSDLKLVAERVGVRLKQ